MSTKHRCDNCQLLITVETNEHGVPLIVDTDASEWQGYDETEKDDRRLLRDAKSEPYGLSEIEDLHEWLDPGAVTPSGQCPVCRSLAYLQPNEAGIRRKVYAEIEIEFGTYDPDSASMLDDVATFLDMVGTDPKFGPSYRFTDVTVYRSIGDLMAEVMNGEASEA